MQSRRVALLEIDPDLVASLTLEERRLLAGIWLPVLELPTEAFDITSLFERHETFGMIVLDGLLMHYLQIGAQPGLRILGSGDVVTARDAPASELVVGAAWRAGSGTSVAMLSSAFFRGVSHAPGLLVSLGARVAEQTERLTTQLMISQLPRVEDRLLAMLWLLAESFGHVTPAGTAVPLILTHEVLGGLVGARRPTVSLALRALADAGAVRHQDRGWLLLKRPEQPESAAPDMHVVEQARPTWPTAASAPASGFDVLGELASTVDRLRVQHLRTVQLVRDRLQDARETAERSAELREKLRRQRELSHRSPSS
jgi:CRP/FNR family transcriptional regulator, cyclic AMP receptor protein